jgi:hypothetical protein
VALSNIRLLKRMHDSLNACGVAAPGQPADGQY